MDRAEVNEAFEDVCKTTYKCMKIYNSAVHQSSESNYFGNCINNLTCTDSFHLHNNPTVMVSRLTHFTGEKTGGTELFCNKC